MEFEITSKRLYDAAVEDSVSTLTSLIQQDPLILDRIISLTSFIETPLHISVLHGHLEFTWALLSHNPHLVNEADSLGPLPLHVAATHGPVEIICELLRLEPGTCLARDKDGKTPLHLAIMKGGRVEVVQELITRACPKSIRLSLDRGETILHLCVKYDNLQALNMSVEDLELRGENDNNNLLNARADDGNTIIHLAAARKHLEVRTFSNL